MHFKRGSSINGNFVSPEHLVVLQPKMRVFVSREGRVPIEFRISSMYHSSSVTRNKFFFFRKGRVKKKQKILFLDRLCHKNLCFSNFELQFSATYSYCTGDSINNSGKELLNWKALQIDSIKVSKSK